MAEQEVVKHTKKLFSIWGGKEHGFWHKVREFLLEIIIIVFAVTLSIWLHGRSEHKHQQEDVKQFLVGLKSDLNNDVNEMELDKKSFLDQKAAFQYVTSIKFNEQLNSDSLKKYYRFIFNTTGLHPNNGRFEGFKSSGKIGAIENKELQNDIMDLYQENIVSLLVSTDGYKSTKKMLFDYVIKNGKRLRDTTSNLTTVLAQDEAQNICIGLRSPDEVLARYTICIDKMKKIIAEINKEYDLKD
jgi:hypothetical protein